MDPTTTVNIEENHFSLCIHTAGGFPSMYRLYGAKAYSRNLTEPAMTVTKFNPDTATKARDEGTKSCIDVRFS